MSLNSTALPAKRALRIGIVHQGRVVHEQVFSESQRIRIGSDHNANIVLAPGQVPHSRTLFNKQGNTWQLCLQGQDQGRISEGKVRDLALRIASGDTKIPLDRSVKGKISLGEVTVLFQLVPAPGGSMQPGAFRPRFVDQDDPAFLGSLALISSAAAVLMIWVVQQEPMERVTIEELRPQVAQMVFENRPIVEQVKAIVAPDPDAPGELVDRVEQSDPGEAGPSIPDLSLLSTDRPPPTMEELKAEAQDRIDHLVFGSRDGDSASRTESVFGHNDQEGEALDVLLRRRFELQKAGIGLAPKQGTGAEIGAVVLQKRDSQDTKLGAGPIVGVRGRAPNTKEVVTSDNKQLEKLLRWHLGPAVKTCYEQVLNVTPSANGRIEIRLELSDGDVVDVFMAYNDIDPEMGACLSRAGNRWQFGDAEGSVIMPYVLSPSQ